MVCIFGYGLYGILLLSESSLNSGLWYFYQCGSCWRRASLMFLGFLHISDNFFTPIVLFGLFDCTFFLIQHIPNCCACYAQSLSIGTDVPFFFSYKIIRFSPINRSSWWFILLKKSGFKPRSKSRLVMRSYWMCELSTLKATPLTEKI